MRESTYEFMKKSVASEITALEDLYANKVLKELIDDKIFEVLIFLDSTEKGKIKEVFILDKIKQEYKRVEGK